jgi:hypothetical protein
MLGKNDMFSPTTHNGYGGIQAKDASLSDSKVYKGESLEDESNHKMIFNGEF